MTSDKQIAANRANAKKSTGPKTEAGKAMSSLNAVTHGATARTLVLPGEDETEVQKLRDAFIAQYEPETPQERELIEMLTQTTIRARRIPALEKALLAWLWVEEERHDDEIRPMINTIRHGPYDEPRPAEAGMIPATATPAQEQLLGLGRVLKVAIENDYLGKLSNYDARFLRQFLKISAELERSQKERAKRKSAAS